MKKIFAILLSLAMVMCMIPMATGVAFATDDQHQAPSSPLKLSSTYVTMKDAAGSTIGDGAIKYYTGENVDLPTVYVNAKDKAGKNIVYDCTDSSKETANVASKTNGTFAWSYKEVDGTTGDVPTKYNEIGTYTVTYTPSTTNEYYVQNAASVSFKVAKVDLGRTSITAPNLTSASYEASGTNYYLKAAALDSIVVKLANGKILTNSGNNQYATALNISEYKSEIKVNAVVKTDTKGAHSTEVTISALPDATHFTGSAKVTITNKTDLSQAYSATIDSEAISTKYYIKKIADIEYTGKVVVPTVNVYMATSATAGKSAGLTLNKDYTVEYSKITNAGEVGQVTVKGIGAFTGEITRQYAITGKTAATTTYSTNGAVSSSKLSTGFTVEIPRGAAGVYQSNVEPSGYPIVKNGTTVLTKGVDYEVTYEDNNVGPTTTYPYTKAVAVFTFKGNYKGTYVTNYTIVANGKEVNNIVLNAPTKAYNGTTQAPTFYVTDYNGKRLSPTSEYKITYSYTDSDGVVRTVTTPKDAYAYTITATGVGNYGGSASTTYTITPFDIANAIVMDSGNIGTNGVPYITVSAYNGATKYEFKQDKDYIVDVTASNTYGGGTCTVTPIPGSNLTGTAKEGIVFIGKNVTKPVETTKTFTATLSATSGTYTILGYAPVAVVYDGSTLLTEDYDYVVTYKDAAGKAVSRMTEVGTYSVVITGIGSYADYKAVTKTFTVTGLANSIKFTNASTESTYTIYKNKAENYTIAAAGTSTSGATVTYTTNDATVATVETNGTVTLTGKVGVATITLTAAASNGYEKATKTLTVCVRPNKLVVKSVTKPAKGQLKVSVTKQKGTPKYQIYVSRNSEFKSGTRKVSYVTDNPSYTKSQSKTVKGLTSGKTYYVKARAMYTNVYGETKYGTWSEVKKVVVK